MDSVRKVLKLSGFGGLNPVQELAVKSGLLEGKSLVVSAPTASGKTLISEIAALEAVKAGKKVAYIVPLRALASEKYEEFKERYRPLGIRVAMSIGDFDSSDPWLANYDIVIFTSEKLDSLLRHGLPWAEQIGLVVADEIHLLNDPGRGPTLELVLTRLRQMSKPLILGLSATINNYQELAEWLEAEPVKSDYRPVKLYQGICFDGKARFMPKRGFRVRDIPITKLSEQTLEKGKQALIFINTRKGAESSAEKLGKLLRDRLKPDERKRLLELSGRVAKVLGHPTKQCERLASCIENGVSFHHAGLVNRQRGMIEKAFRAGIIKIICTTPTLSAGLDLPAWRVIIRDLKRFSSFRGMDYIPVLEIQQMMGRAGRPRFDSEGEAILLPKSKAEAKYAWENYINGEPEDITSKLGVEPVLRMHVLALIASGTTTTRRELMEFFSRTFYAHQYQEMQGLEKILDRVLELLEGFRFITRGKENNPPSEGGESGDGRPLFKSASSLLEREGEELMPTRIGRRVSELYIDPLTANQLIKSLEKAKKPGRGLSHLGTLHTISNTIEMKPLLSLRKKDLENIEEAMAQAEKDLLEKPPNPWDLEYDDFLRSLKTALMLRGWTQEEGEDNLLERFGITPGELRARLDTADWLLYSIQELGLLLGHMDLLKDIRKTRVRVKYGVREELLPLVRLRGIGRRRARLLYNSGVKSIKDMRGIPLQSLEGLIGPKTARDVKGQLGETESGTTPVTD